MNERVVRAGEPGNPALASPDLELPLMNERVVRAGEPGNPALASPPRITDAPRCMRPTPVAC